MFKGLRKGDGLSRSLGGGGGGGGGGFCVGGAGFFWGRRDVFWGGGGGRVCVGGGEGGLFFGRESFFYCERGGGRRGFVGGQGGREGGVVFCWGGEGGGFFEFGDGFLGGPRSLRPRRRRGARLTSGKNDLADPHEEGVSRRPLTLRKKVSPCWVQKKCTPAKGSQRDSVPGESSSRMRVRKKEEVVSGRIAKDVPFLGGEGG